MADKISHSEISARGGKSKSPAKLAAVRDNLEKARQVQSARRAARESADSLRIAVRPAKRGQTGLPASICDKATRHDARGGLLFRATATFTPRNRNGKADSHC